MKVKWNQTQWGQTKALGWEESKNRLYTINVEKEM